jgi:hypothetical protein
MRECNDTGNARAEPATDRRGAAGHGGWMERASHAGLR